MKMAMKMVFNQQEMQKFVMAYAKSLCNASQQFADSDDAITLTEAFEIIEELFSSTDNSMRIYREGDDYCLTMDQESAEEDSELILKNMFRNVGMEFDDE